jgi:hypothetical protein
MRAVNLLPKDANKSARSISREDPAVVVGSALGAVVLVALAGGFMNVHSKVNHNQKLLDGARAEYAQVSAEVAQREPVKTTTVKPKVIIPVPSVTSEEGPRLAAVSAALDARIAWDRILREFSLVLPSDVSVQSVSLQAPDPNSTGAPTGQTAQGFSIQGHAFSHDGVARLLSRLMLIPDLENVTLGSSDADPSSGAVSFSIAASIKGAVAPAVPAAPVVTPPATTDTTGSSS